MTGKEFLQQVLQANKNLKSRLEQLIVIQTMAQKITTIISGTPSISDRSQSRIENAVVNVFQESEKIENAVTEFLDLRQRAVELIAKVANDDERIILEYRYLTDKSWAEISKVMGFKIRYIYRLHGRALLSFEKIFEAGDKSAQKCTKDTLTNDV